MCRMAYQKISLAHATPGRCVADMVSLGSIAAAALTVLPDHFAGANALAYTMDIATVGDIRFSSAHVCVGVATAAPRGHALRESH